MVLATIMIRVMINWCMHFPSMHYVTVHELCGEMHSDEMMMVVVVIVIFISNVQFLRCPCEVNTGMAKQ